MSKIKETKYPQFLYWIANNHCIYNSYEELLDNEGCDEKTARKLDIARYEFKDTGKFSATFVPEKK